MQKIDIERQLNLKSSYLNISFSRWQYFSDLAHLVTCNSAHYKQQHGGVLVWAWSRWAHEQAAEYNTMSWNSVGLSSTTNPKPTYEPESRLDDVSGSGALRVVVKVRKVRVRRWEYGVHKLWEQGTIGQRGVVLSVEGVPAEVNDIV